MNASNVLKYGNRTVMDVLDSLPFDNWETEGVCGIWSVKNIVAHLTSYEWVLADILRELEAGGPTPHLDAYRLTGMVFNDEQVDARKDMSAAETLAEYQAAHADVLALASLLPFERYRETGNLPWYGLEYSLDDYIVYAIYGHKREHIAQVNVYRDLLKR